MEQYYYKIYMLIFRIQKKIKKNTWTILIIKKMWTEKDLKVFMRIKNNAIYV